MPHPNHLCWTIIKSSPGATIDLPPALLFFACCLHSPSRTDRCVALHAYWPLKMTTRYGSIRPKYVAGAANKFLAWNQSTYLVKSSTTQGILCSFALDLRL